jgi:hypothetical protein
MCVPQMPRGTFNTMGYCHQVVSRDHFCVVVSSLKLVSERIYVTPSFTMYEMNISFLIMLNAI